MERSKAMVCAEHENFQLSSCSCVFLEHGYGAQLEDGRQCALSMQPPKASQRYHWNHATLRASLPVKGDMSIKHGRSLTKGNTALIAVSEMQTSSTVYLVDQAGNDRSISKKSNKT